MCAAGIVIAVCVCVEFSFFVPKFSLKKYFYLLKFKSVFLFSFCNLITVNQTTFQIAVLTDDILKNVEYDALRVVFNRFQSVISFKPTITTILSPEVGRT
jgi:F0F1-type ATP synthase gamma subunit